MQYTIIAISNKRRSLIGAHELYALSQKTVQASDDFSEHSLTDQFLYGVYNTQPEYDFPRSEIRRNIDESLDIWLIHIDGTRVINPGIEAIELSDSILFRQCSHGPASHERPSVAFSALVKAPPLFGVKTKSHHAGTAFLRWHNHNTLISLINRKGLFAFTCETKHATCPLPRKTGGNVSIIVA
jgi:hypothetical protein